MSSRSGRGSGGGNRRSGGSRGGGWWSSGKKRRLHQLEAGARGFFCTCNNFQEKNCIREAYNLLNEFAPPEQTPSAAAEEPERDEEDPSEMLHRQIADMKAEDNRPKRFQSLTTDVDNCIFIQANVEDPVALGHTIVRHISDTKVQKSRFLLRLVPIEVTCGVSLPVIIDHAGKLFDKHFLGEPTTFSIVFNRRYNNSVSRDVIIKEFADLIGSKNCSHKADLTNPKLAVIVEVLKGVCMMSVVPDYYKLRKYNLVELCTPKEAKAEVPVVVDTADDAKIEKSVEEDVAEKPVE